MASNQRLILGFPETDRLTPRTELGIGPREGIEGYALANLRSNLRQMMALRRGTFWFGDHDFGMFVEVTCFGDETEASVTLDLAPADRWEIPLPGLSTQTMEDLVATVNAIEDELGPLTGACSACGVKDPMVHTEPYRREA